MNNRPECIPCCLRRVLRTADHNTTDEWLHRKILSEVMQDLARIDELATPAELAHAVARQTARALGNADPFADEKKRWIDEITGNGDWIRAEIESRADSFAAALHLSAAANILDNELRQDLSRRAVSLKTLVRGFEKVAFNQDSVEDFRLAVQKAKKIVFIHDTAAELFFDRLLIERMEKPVDAVFSAVREQPVLADATAEDAAAAGIDQVAQVIDLGIDCLGVPLNASSQSFREHYESADVVIAKGQAAYQTLDGDDLRKEGVPKEVFYLLRVKCTVMARELGVDPGDAVLEMG